MGGLCPPLAMGFDDVRSAQCPASWQGGTMGNVQRLHCYPSHQSGPCGGAVFLKNPSHGDPFRVSRSSPKDWPEGMGVLHRNIRNLAPNPSLFTANGDRFKRIFLRQTIESERRKFSRFSGGIQDYPVDNFQSFPFCDMNR